MPSPGQVKSSPETIAAIEASRHVPGWHTWLLSPAQKDSAAGVAGGTGGSPVLESGSKPAGGD